MSIEELQKSIEEMKAQGQSEEEIAGAFYLLFRDGKINVEQLEALVNVLGFDLSEEFKAMDPEQQKNGGYEVLDEEQPENEDVQDEEDEEKQAMKLLGQDKKEQKEETSEPEEKDEEDEEDEEKKAMKFFR